MRLFAVLREQAGTSELLLEDLDDGLDLAELKRELGRRRPELADTLERVAGAIGTDYVDDTRRLTDGDEVSLLPPVSGGSGGAPTDGESDASPDRGVFELSASALDAAAALERVAHPSCGGLTVFVGTTRATNRGQDVVRLEYEAFDAMTGPEMGRIFERCRAELAATPEGERRLRLFVQHRVGTVEIGEPSVVVAAASPHRDLAFRACRYLIDELKQTLPVWKKEIYADGHHWIGDRS